MAAPDKFSLKHRMLSGLAAFLASWLMRAMFATCRVEMLSPEKEDKYFGGGLPAIGVTWHRAAIYFLYYFGPRRAAVMISRSKDGEYLARFAAKMGIVPVRGSSQRGGFQALLEMAELLNTGEVKYAATVADGPRGPRYHAKKGMISLACRTGLPLIPLAWSSDRVWVFKKAWDRTMVPKPFAKIKILAGRELRYPDDMTPAQMEGARAELEQELMRITGEVDKLAGFKDPD